MSAAAIAPAGEAGRLTIDWSQPVSCLGCARRLRPARGNPEDFPPGAVAYDGRGRCCNCLRKLFGVDTNPPLIPAGARHRDNMAALRAYLRRRRARLATVARRRAAA